MAKSKQINRMLSPLLWVRSLFLIFCVNGLICGCSWSSRWERDQLLQSSRISWYRASEGKEQDGNSTLSMWLSISVSFLLYQFDSFVSYAGLLPGYNWWREMRAARWISFVQIYRSPNNGMVSIVSPAPIAFPPLSWISPTNASIGLNCYASVAYNAIVSYITLKLSRWVTASVGCFVNGVANGIYIYI
jgi:hypothetical protein